MRMFTIMKFEGKLNQNFYAIKRNGEIIIHIENKDDEIVLHAIDKKVKFNRRIG